MEFNFVCLLFKAPYLRSVSIVLQDMLLPIKGYPDEFIIEDMLYRCRVD